MKIRNITGIILAVAGLITLFFSAQQYKELFYSVSFPLAVLFYFAVLLASIDKRIFFSKVSLWFTIVLLIISIILYLFFNLNITISTSLFFGFLLLLQLVKLTSKEKL
ncbi:MAG TPA: hypothetical protein VGQ09_09325 [Chitinophagaceae bacterium]|jgi:cbb3-type cytochrome oxidase subunit 1|nr:hypothetical protein [Chitinophagaceae bacterium]